MSALHSLPKKLSDRVPDRMEQLLSINCDDYECRMVMNVVVVSPLKARPC